MGYLLIETGKFFGVLLVEHSPDGGEHPLHILGKAGGFLLCLQDGDFRGLDEVGMYILQTELVIGTFAGFLLRQQTAYHFLHLGNETYEDGGVGDVEAGVEHREYHRQKGALTALGGVVAHDAADGIDKGIEDAQHPDDAKDIEEQMGKGCTTSLKVGTKGCKVGSGGGTDILTHDEGYAQIDRQHTSRTKQDGDCHDGC